MAPSRRVLSIALALLVSVSFMVTGYVLSSPFSALRANALSSEELLKAYAKKDTDADGLPDWQEELYGADLNNPRSLDPTMTDKEAVDSGKVEPRFTSEDPGSASSTPKDYFEGSKPPTAGSFTERFSRKFLQSYVEAGGKQGVDEAGQQMLISELLGEVSREAGALVSSDFSQTQVRTSPSVTATAYAEGIESVLLTYDIPEEWNVATLASELVEHTDESARGKLATFSEMLGKSAVALAALTVPQKYATEHLALIRATDTVAKIAGLLARYEEDPVAALGALGNYEGAVRTVQDTWIALAPDLASEGTPAPGSFAARILQFATDIENTP
ncbi:MAG: hypothetical protein WBK28_02140 [Minisyncoccia bacterium]